LSAETEENPGVATVLRLVVEPARFGKNPTVFVWN